MDEEYKPIITDEERATRRAQRAGARRKKQREKLAPQILKLTEELSKPE